MKLPIPFTNYIRTLLGENESQKLADALEQEPSVSIRLNPADFRLEDRDAACCSTLTFEPVPWATNGYYLNKRLTFTFDPLFHAGCYYVQEASSMFVEQALKQYLNAPVVMLDLCAAPGGKSTHARSVLPESSLLVANEVSRTRAQILAENLAKWGDPDVVVTNNDPSDFSPLKAFFDVILTDVPCSGEGMFRKDPVAIEEWSSENVHTCWQRQRRIIKDIWPSLKPGGLLIYSTCTYNTQEDEENVRWIEQTYGAEVLPLDTVDSWGITGSLLTGYEAPVYRFLPSRARGEGFFLAVLRKPVDEEEAFWEASLPKKKSKKAVEASLFSKEMMSQAASWLNRTDYRLIPKGSELIAFNESYLMELEALRGSLKVIDFGITVGELKGKDLAPFHDLVMNRIFNMALFPREELTYDQAIAYLRKEAITLSVTASRGYVVVTYKQVPIGFVKNIGNRANNLYPQEWRIRTTRLPDEITTL